MNVWEKLIKLFIQMDIGNGIFEEALWKIGEYLKDLSESTRMQAEMACGDAADYCAPFDSFQTKIRSNADSLCTMREYLRQQPQTEAVLRQTYQMNCLSHLLGKQIDYLALNQFSLESELTEAETAKFHNMLEKLPSFAHIAVWEADLSILNAKIEKTFQDYENAVSQYARTVGENFVDYLKEKEAAAEKLKPFGYDDDMFEAFVGKIERNVEISGKRSRLERSELWMKADF